MFMRKSHYASFLLCSAQSIKLTSQEGSKTHLQTSVKINAKTVITYPPTPTNVVPTVNDNKLQISWNEIDEYVLQQTLFVLFIHFDRSVHLFICRTGIYLLA